MKQIKITPKLLNMHLEDILIHAGAVYEQQAFPEHVYLSDKDFKSLKGRLRRKFRKLTNMDSIDYYLGVYILNLGPNTSLGKVIKPGTMLVDDYAIAKHIDTI